MCGRYSLFVSPDDLADRFGVAVEGYEPRYNAAPGQDLPVIADDRTDRLTRMEWGLVPSWADSRDDGGHINARAETLSETPSFSDAFAQTGGELAAGRCLVPADGFYEWVDSGGERQPYRVRLADERPFAMAGLWAQWRPATTQTGLDAFANERAGASSDRSGESPEVVETFAIVTTEPNDVVGDLHHRMAVVLPAEAESRWLSAPPDEARDLLDPYPGDQMEAYPVSQAVNDPANDSPAVVESVE
jgi:putative SOS response-associated peptidase YedK